MEQEHWSQVESLFLKAIEVPADERDRFLDKACQGDERLRKEVNSLLACDDPSAPLLSANDQAPDMAGRRIGPYRLVRLLGQGGMGAVYLAVRDDDQFRKEVAIKLLKRGMDTDFMLLRFRQERQILANLEHPFIARLLDGGATDDGLPYFVLEYVDGTPITQYSIEKGLNVAERLRLFRLVCEAVQYAHQNLVVHRDLKPGNILITREGIPKLLDFGIAKLLDPDLRSELPTLTQRGLRLMTPSYASPEQALGLPISTASDIYSLGAVLYELLSGQRAHRFQSDSPSEIDKVICEIEPEKPSAAGANRRLAGDLDNIILTAMRKDPQRRYPSVAEFSEDIRRHMEGLPVSAREDRWTYRAAKFIRRNRLAVAATLLVMASLVGGTIVALGQARRSERRFQLVRGLANSMLFDLHDQMSLLPGTTALRASTIQTVVTYLDRLAQDARSDPSLDLEIARAYERVGSVEGHPFQSNLGQTAAALTHYRKALAIYEELTRHPEIRVQALAGVVNTHMLAGDIEVILGNVAAAQSHLEKAAAIAGGSSEIPPNTLTTLYSHLADTEFQRGSFGAELEYYRKALGVAQNWAAADRGPKAAAALRYAYQRVATSQANTGDLYGARDSFERAVKIAEELLRRPDASYEDRYSIQSLRQSFGDLLAATDDPNLGDPAAALALHEANVTLSEQLVAADANDRNARRTLASSYRRVGLVLVDENPAEALNAYRKALPIAEELNRADLPNLEYRYGLARGCVGMGEALLKLNRSREAAPYLARALELAKSIEAIAPERIWLLRVLTRAYIVSGNVMLARGDTADALDTYREGLAAAEKLFKRVPSSLHHELDAADLDEAMARYYLTMAARPGLVPVRRAELRAEARSWFRRSLAIWQEWTRRKVAVSYAARRERQLAAAMAGIGN